MTEAFDRDRLVWLATNLLRGVADDRLVEALENAGMTRTNAAHAIETVRASPAFVAAAPFVEDARRLQMLARRTDTLLRSVPRARTIARTTSEPLDEFFASYVAEGVPAVVTDVVVQWPAFRRWTPEWIAERCGDPEVTVARTLPRPSGPHVYPFSPTTTLRMSELARRIASDEADDLYMVASNEALRGPLSALLEDITPSPLLARRDTLAEEALLWLGPRGTRTELHHDVHSILACQIAGRKRWRLVHPWDSVMTSRAVSTLSTLRFDSPELDEAFVREVVVEPGEAIFVPVGYWHSVEALDPSITVSLTGLVGQSRHTGFRLDGKP